MAMTDVSERRARAGSPVARSLARVLGLSALVLCAAVAVVLLTPVALGGSTSYVVTEGTSMLPTFRAGGVVLTREANDYDVGDVVAYRSDDLGAVVMHRIVGRDGDAYVFQGDNNDYLDRDRPGDDDLIGREWVYLPHVGRAVVWLREPIVFGAVIATIVLVGLVVPVPTRRGGRRRAA